MEDISDCFTKKFPTPFQARASRVVPKTAESGKLSQGRLGNCRLVATLASVLRQGLDKWAVPRGSIYHGSDYSGMNW